MIATHWISLWSKGRYCHTARIRGKLWAYGSGAPKWALDLLFRYRMKTGATLPAACQAVASAVTLEVERRIGRAE